MGMLNVHVCVVFWGGREGYQTLLNTDVKRELDHMATFFRMAVGMCWTRPYHCVQCMMCFHIMW